MSAASSTHHPPRTAPRLAERRKLRAQRPVGPHYKWIALTNTTLGALMATIDASIVLIALPAIFKGIGINPLAPGESSYFLWLLLGYMVVTATLLVTFGRISDMFGRVRLYNLGFAIFTVGSTLLAFTPGKGNTGALELIIFRLIQGVGSGFLFSNSAAILTDAFPMNQRGRALGINQIAAIAGSFIGLILGGVLAAINWRLVFLVSVPVGLAGTIWAYTMLRETATIRGKQTIDWLGNITFAVGLTVLLLSITYGIEPYGDSPMGWGNPLVIGGIVLGILLLTAFIWIELRVAKDPMFRLDLFKIRMFTAGNISGFLSALSRGGLQFMLVIWLQGIWLPLHGYSFEETPLWAGIYMTPLLVGFIVMGPISGYLSDRFGARVFSTTGMLVQAIGFIGLTLPACELQLPGLRHPALHSWLRLWPVRFTQHQFHHEQRSARDARRGVWYAGDVPEWRVTREHRPLLQHCDGGPRRRAPLDVLQRADEIRRASQHGDADRPPAADGRALRRVPGLQPYRAVAAAVRAEPYLSGESGGVARQDVLPQPDFIAIHGWPARRVLHLGHDVFHRRGRLVAARQSGSPTWRPTWRGACPISSATGVLTRRCPSPSVLSIWILPNVSDTRIGGRIVQVGPGPHPN